MDKKKKKSSNTKSQIQLLLVALGILLVVVAYFVIYTDYTEKADLQEAQNKQVQAEVTRLQNLENNKATYLEETARMQEYIKEFESRFPSMILPEDSIMMVKNMEDNTRTAIASISFGGITAVPYTAAAGQAAPADGTAADGAATAGGNAGGVVSTEAQAYANTTLYEDSLGLSIECTYSDFKGLVRYIYTQKERMTVRNVSISYNRESGELSGNMTLSTYFLAGTDKMYTEPYIPDMGMGVDTIFGNIQAAE